MLVPLFLEWKNGRIQEYEERKFVLLPNFTD